MSTTPIDSGSAQGFVSSCAFIVLGHISAFISEVDISTTLQHTSYSVAIVVGLDTLLGSPIKSSFKRFWNRICGKQR
jgi:hypothetical protein